MSGSPRLTGSLLFHLNLSYSAIEARDHGKVVERCYRPLLGLLERLPWLKLTLEASGHTLLRIERLDPGWLEDLCAWMAKGRVEFVGSGDSQLIGPLVPESVNLWNQRLGQETYQRLLGTRPRVALVNEMAWSQGIVDSYLEADYRALVMEWNNPRRVHPEWDAEWRYRPATTRSASGRPTRVLWADALAFQKFQRAVFDDLEVEEYADWVVAQATSSSSREGAARHLFLYANDAEIFDYRPGRYRAEAPLVERGDGSGEPRSEESEWDRMERILRCLHGLGVRIVTPSETLAAWPEESDPELILNHVSDPIPVKKQPKYNVTRWALTGRDDLGLNTRCFARARGLAEHGGTPEAWRALCRDWASDLRTHLTETRWQRLEAEQLAETTRLAAPGDPRAPLPASTIPARQDRELAIADVDRGARVLTVRTDEVCVELLPSRGLAISKLTFPEVSPRPLCGTLPHGHFEDIGWTADFYSGHLVLDVPVRARVTDLERAEPEIELLPDRVRLTAILATELGPLKKCVEVFADRVELHYGLSAWGERPACSLRAGFVTLLPDGLSGELSIACANGGRRERFPLSCDVDHGASVSPLVSAHTAFGATDGSIEIDDGRVALCMQWPNWQAAAVPLLVAKEVGDQRFVRLAFSLAEIDETHRPGARLSDFSLALSAKRIRP